MSPRWMAPPNGGYSGKATGKPRGKPPKNPASSSQRKGPPPIRERVPDGTWNATIERYESFGYTVRVEQGGTLLTASWYTFTKWGARASVSRYIRGQERNRRNKLKAETFTITGKTA